MKNDNDLRKDLRKLVRKDLKSYRNHERKFGI